MQQRGQFLQHRLQFQLVAQLPHPDELHIDPHGGGDQSQFLRGDPRAYLHVASADEQRVQGAVAGAAVELRLVREIVHYDQNLEELLEAQLLAGPRYLLLLLYDGAQGALVPFIEIYLLTFCVHAHVVLYEVLHGLPAIVDLNGGAQNVDPLEHAGTVGRAILFEDGADQRHRFSALAGPEEDPRAGHAGNDRVSRLLRAVLRRREKLDPSHSLPRELCNIRADRGRDLVAQARRHAVELLAGVPVAAAVGGAPLGCLGMNAIGESVAAMALAAHGLGGLPGQIVPDPSGLLAITDVAVGQFSAGRSGGSQRPTSAASDWR